MSSHTSTARDPHDLMHSLNDQSAPVIVDVRSPAEFEATHIEGSYNVPLDLLGEHAELLAARVGSAPVLVCQSGTRAEDARRRLSAVGVVDAQVLDGGLPAFQRAGGRVVEGRQRWSIERQVRMAAGSLVLLGVAGSYLAAPGWRVLSGVIGAGLTFSAVSNTCAMGRVLAQMPWNRDAAALTAADAVRQFPHTDSRSRT